MAENQHVVSQKRPNVNTDDDLNSELNQQDSNVLKDSSIDNSLNTSVDSQASSQSTFKKIVRLNEAFIKKGRESHCLACGEKLTTVEFRRIMSHIRKCKKMDNELRNRILDEYEMSINVKPLDRNGQLNEAWANVCIENNVSFQIVDSRTWQVFAELIDPEWKYADRHKLAQEIIPKLSRKVEDEFNAKIKNKIGFVCVEFDHWTDITSKSLLGVVVTLANGDRYLQNLIDVSREGHAALVTVGHLKSTLSTIPQSAINSIVSDSASACRLTRQLIVDQIEYQHVIQHRCLAHLLNNMGGKWGENEFIKESLAWASKLVNHVTHKSDLLALLCDDNHKRPKKACSTRWYSTVNMAESLLDCKTVLIEKIKPGPGNNEWIANEKTWVDLEKAIMILRPLANCIAVSERRDGALGEGVNSLLGYARYLFMSDWAEPLTIAGISSFLTYFGPKKLGQEEFSLMLAAYVLDRRNKCDFITDDGLDLALEAILQVAQRSRCSTASINAVIVEEYADYCAQKDIFSKHQQPYQTSESWWEEISSCSSLRQVAIRIARLRSSSANIERTFSSLKWIQGSKRTNLSTENLVHLGRIKISMTDDKRASSRSDISTPENQHDMNDDAETVDAHLCDDHPDANSSSKSTSHYVPELFEPEVEALFSEFVSYIDFSVVNRLVSPEDQAQTGLTAEQIAQLKEMSRNLRKRIKSGAAQVVEDNRPIQRSAEEN